MKIKEPGAYHSLSEDILLFFNINIFILIGGWLLYNSVLVLPYINMNQPRVYTCSPSWTPLPPSSPYHPYRMLGAGTRGWSKEVVWGGRWEGGSGLGTHVHPWLIHVDVWQNQYSIVKQNKVKIKIKKKKKNQSKNNM